jgi:hypothetical protein
MESTVPPSLGPTGAEDCSHPVKRSATRGKGHPLPRPGRAGAKGPQRFFPRMEYSPRNFFPVTNPKIAMEYSIRIDRGVVYGPSTRTPSSQASVRTRTETHSRVGRICRTRSRRRGRPGLHAPSRGLPRPVPDRKPTEKSEFPSLGSQVRIAPFARSHPLSRYSGRGPG